MSVNIERRTVRIDQAVDGVAILYLDPTMEHPIVSVYQSDTGEQVPSQITYKGNGRLHVEPGFYYFDYGLRWTQINWDEIKVVAVW